MPTYVNAPGRFSTKPWKVAKDAAHWTSLKGAVAVAPTEVADPKRAAALEVDGWTLHHHGGPGMGECAILTQDAHFPTVLDSRAAKVADGIKPSVIARMTHPGTAKRLRRDMYARVVVAETKAGHVQVLAQVHLPAHLEGAWRLMPNRLRVKRLVKGRNRRVRMWLTAVNSLRKQVSDLAAEHHADDVVVMADWNLNGHAAWVQQVMARVWPGLALVAPKRGDIGVRGRSIGWVLTSMKPVQVRTYRARSSDHKANVFDLAHVNAHPIKHKVEKPPPPFEHCTYNGATMDNKTKTFIQTLEKALGYSLTIVQGCYHPGVSQSAGTHDGGGVIDLAPFDWKRKVDAVKVHGGFGWQRLPIPRVWGEHIHFGIRNHGTLSPAAKAQQRDFDGHPPLDGLADHAVDRTWHPDPPVGFDYVAAWRKLHAPKRPAKKAAKKP